MSNINAKRGRTRYPGLIDSFSPTYQTYALDNLSAPALAAYSVRKLRRLNTRPCFRLIRSSDSDQKDFYFVNGVVSNQEIVEWKGSGSAIVYKWYDQSGSNIDLIQTTGSVCPTFISGSLPTINFNGSQYLNFPSNITYTSGQAYSAMYVGNRSGSTLSLIGFAGDSGADPFGYSIADFFSDGSIYDRGAASYARWALTSGSTNTIILGGTRSTGNVVNHYLNTSSNSSGALAASVILSYLGLLRGYSTAYYNTGNISEAILFSSELSSGDRISLRTSMNAFYTVY
jgi:hypothetical protein